MTPTVLWRPRTSWRTTATSPAGYSATGTWHAFETDAPGPPLPHSDKPSASPLCGREADSLENMRAEPPADAYAVCRKCWTAVGRDPAALDMRRAVAKARETDRQRAARRQSQYLSDLPRMVTVVPEDLLTFLERFEIYETEEFVRAALDAIERDRLRAD